MLIYFIGKNSPDQKENVFLWQRYIFIASFADLCFVTSLRIIPHKIRTNRKISPKFKIWNKEAVILTKTRKLRQISIVIGAP